MNSFSVQAGDYAPFHAGYVRLMQDEKDITAKLEAQKKEFLEYISSLSDDDGNHTYAPAKWTIKQVIQHIIDAERIFAFRLLAMSRGEQQPIPGFDQDDYANAVDVTHRSLKDLHQEFSTVRDATLSLVNALQPDQLTRTGIVGGYPLTARAVPFILAGHLEHHLVVLRDRYGVTSLHAVTR